MKKLKQENINNILFLDIETAPNWRFFKDVPDNVQKEWIYKFKFKDGAPQYPDPETNQNYSNPIYMEKYIKYFADLWEQKAGLHPEFSRIVCVSMGYIYNGTLRIKSINHKDEKDLLQDFNSILSSFVQSNKFTKLCAHYGKGFDFPFIAKRMIIHRMNVPFILDTYGLKPWEMESLLDTHEIWKGGTLSSIAMALGIPTPKDDIEGEDVSRCYHNGKIDRITEYCEKDVVTLVNVFKGMRGEELLSDSEILKTV